MQAAQKLTQTGYSDTPTLWPHKIVGSRAVGKQSSYQGPCMWFYSSFQSWGWPFAKTPARKLLSCHFLKCCCWGQRPMTWTVWHRQVLTTPLYSPSCSQDSHCDSCRLKWGFLGSNTCSERPTNTAQPLHLTLRLLPPPAEPLHERKMSLDWYLGHSLRGSCSLDTSSKLHRESGKPSSLAAVHRHPYSLPSSFSVHSSLSQHCSWITIHKCHRDSFRSRTTAVSQW